MSPFDLRAEDLVGTSFLRLIPQADRVAVAGSIATLTPVAPIKNQEHPVLTPSDAIHCDANGRPHKALGTVQDVSEREDQVRPRCACAPRNWLR